MTVLQNRPNLPYPTVPTPAPLGPTRTRHTKSTVIGKHDAAQSAEEGGGGNATAGDALGNRGLGGSPDTMGRGRHYTFFMGELAGRNRTSSQEAGGDHSVYGTVEAGSAVSVSLSVPLVLSPHQYLSFFQQNSSNTHEYVCISHENQSAPRKGMAFETTLLDP